MSNQFEFLIDRKWKMNLLFGLINLKGELLFYLFLIIFFFKSLKIFERLLFLIVKSKNELKSQ